RFSFRDTATIAIYPLSLHDALPICDIDPVMTGTVSHRAGWPVRRRARGTPPGAKRVSRGGQAVTGRNPGRECSKAVMSSTWRRRSEEHTSELQSRVDVVCRLLLEKT